MNNPRINRRRFLDVATWLAGGAFVAPYLNSKALIASPALPVGLLLPAIDRQAGPGKQFARGLQMGFTSANRNVTLSTVDDCKTSSQAYEQVLPLLKKGLRLFVWMSDSPINPALTQRLAEHGAVLLMSGAGANLPRAVDDSPYVFYHSLGLWQGAWALGAWAAKNLGKRASIISSFYDSGYDHLYAFQLGLENAGGELLRTRVTGLRSSDLADALTQLKHDRPDFAAPFYSSAASSSFLDAYTAAGLSSLPMAGSGFLAGGDGLAHASRAMGAYTALGWGSGVSGAQAWGFRSTYQRQMRVVPTAFDLLGYETAALIDAAYQRIDTGTASGLSEAFRALQVSSPRGALQLAKPWPMTSGALYLRQARSVPGGLENMVLTPLPGPDYASASIRAWRAALKTGFSSAYLCV